MKWSDKKEILEDLIVEKKLSYEEIGRMFDCSGSNIKKVAVRLGIKLEQRRKINENENFNSGTAKKGICENCGKEYVIYLGHNGHFCSLKCSSEYRHNQKYQDFLQNPEKYKRANYMPKAFKDDILKEQGCVCQICKCEPIHNNMELPFILDHIDGNASNNERENLRCICPNCNSQLETRKKNSHKSARYYYKYGIYNKMKQYFIDNDIDIESL